MNSAKVFLLFLLVFVCLAFTALAETDAKLQTLKGDFYIVSTNIDVDKDAESATKKFASLEIVDPYTGQSKGEAGVEYTYFGEFSSKQNGGHAFCSGCHELAKVSFSARQVEGKSYCKGCHDNAVLPSEHTHVMPASNGNIFFNHGYSHSDQTFARLKKQLGLNQDLTPCVLCHVGANHIPIKYGNEPTNIGMEDGKIQLLVLSNPKALARLKAVKCVKTIKGDPNNERDITWLVTDAKQCK